VSRIVPNGSYRHYCRHDVVRETGEPRFRALQDYQGRTRAQIMRRLLQKSDSRKPAKFAPAVAVIRSA